MSAYSVEEAEPSNSSNIISNQTPHPDAPGVSPSPMSLPPPGPFWTDLTESQLDDVVSSIVREWNLEGFGNFPKISSEGMGGAADPSLTPLTAYSTSRLSSKLAARKGMGGSNNAAKKISAFGGKAGKNSQQENGISAPAARYAISPSAAGLPPPPPSFFANNNNSAGGQGIASVMKNAQQTLLSQGNVHNITT